jgi:ATP/ADP translocase
MSDVTPTPDPAEPRIVVDTQDVTIRRAPRLLPFLLTGAGLGVLVAAILAVSAPASRDVTQFQAFAYLAVVGIVIGGAVAALIVIILDRILGKRTSSATAEHDDIVE